MESNHNLTITGNLFVEGGGIPVVNTLGGYQVNVNYTVPVQAQGISTSGSSVGISDSDISKIAERVWAKQTNDMTVEGSIGKWITGKVMTISRFLGLK